MRTLLLAIACAAAFGMAAPAARAWEFSLPYVQVPGQKGQQPPGGYDGGARPQAPAGPPAKPDAGRMSEDARKSLHRDLDKANREIYGRGQQQQK